MICKEAIVNEEHFKYLLALDQPDPRFVGRNAFIWGNSILGNGHDIDPRLNLRFDRDYLFQYCEDRQHTNLDCLIATLAWVGMRYSNGRRLLTNRNLVLSVVEHLRNENIESRAQAFELFTKAKQNGELNGLGIAFFTKLICFLAPHLNGYIMDQWVAISVNLLNARGHIVNISNAGWVTNNNNGENYECFCSFIDTLSLRMNCTGFETEERLFSSGGGRGVWRQYVRHQYV